MRMLTDELTTRRRWLKEMQQRNQAGGRKDFSPHSVIWDSMNTSCRFRSTLRDESCKHYSRLLELSNLLNHG